jgi:glycerol-3-phosphate dehydrogenase
MIRRNQDLLSIAGKKFDLVVIGAGLLGAGIALEAASSGFSVLIVDKGDFASGSSSRTSKIAGAEGVLTGSHFKLLAREVSRVRMRKLLQRAPHMVKDFAFLMPIANDKFFFGLKAQLALAVQDVRANVLGRNRGHRRLSAREVVKAAPALAPEILAGGLAFHDCFFDDSRFVIEMIKAAQTKGAIAINYVEAKDFELQNAEIKSVLLWDRLAGKDYTVLPRAVVSACGVWTDTVAKLVDPQAEELIKVTRSTYITLPPSALETGGALLLPAPNNRFVFVMPWERALLVGTTTTAYEGFPEDALPTTEEISFLLETINSYNRGGRGVSREDVACAWAGLNIVPTQNNETPALFRGPAGLITGYGGHIGDFQKMAELAVHILTKKIGQGENAITFGQPQKTAQPAMLGGFQDRADYLATISEISSRARSLGLEPASIDHLLSNYGKDALIVLDLAESNPALVERICPDFPPIMAEVTHCVENEMAISLEDVLCRRIRLGFLHREQCLAAAPRVGKLMQELCGWDSPRLRSELSALARNLASQLAPVS